MYKITFGKFVKRDLNFITDIIFRFTFSQSIVDKLYEEIISKIYSLIIFPNRCSVYKSYRNLTIKGKYNVFYKVDDNKKEVQVHRILFSSSNYENIF